MSVWSILYLHLYSVSLQERRQPSRSDEKMQETLLQYFQFLHCCCYHICGDSHFLVIASINLSDSHKDHRGTIQSVHAQ